MATNQKQPFVNLESVYHEEFKELYRSYIKVSEEVLGVANCSHDHSVGYFVVTTLRGIVVGYQDTAWFGGRPKIRYAHKDVPGHTTSAMNFDWLPPPVSPLKNGEKEHRNINQILHTDLIRLEKNLYSVQYKGQRVQLVELMFFGKAGWSLGSPCVFQQPEGEEIYNLLLKCLRGEITLSKPQVNEKLISELERLSKLYQDGLLSSDQFEAAKNRLIHG